MLSKDTRWQSNLISRDDLQIITMNFYFARSTVVKFITKIRLSTFFASLNDPSGWKHNLRVIKLNFYIGTVRRESE